MTASFRRDGDYFIVKFSYDPDVVLLLKDAVPSWARRWDPVVKEWRINAAFGKTLASAMRRTGYMVVGIDDPSAVDSTGWAEALLRAVGLSRAEEVHRVLTKVLHPDNPGGDGRLQQQLNDARARLEGR